MTQKDNIFVARRNIVDYIWKSAKLEGLTVTYPATDAIFNGMSAAKVPVDEIIAVNNLKHAWRFILEDLDYPPNLNFICEINRIVGGDTLIRGAGSIRKLPASIGGTTWKPDIPIESQVKEQLSETLSIKNPTERAIMLTLYIMRKHMFIYGNKRTAMLAGNHVMISSGCGIISVPIDEIENFRELLIAFYESGNPRELSLFLYDKCIDGMEFEPED
jgi:hypothetical protein